MRLRIPLAKEILVENIPLAKETFLIMSPFWRDFKEFQHKCSLFQRNFLKTDANLAPKCQFLGVFVKYIPLAKDFGRKIYLHERIGAGRNALLATRGLGSPRQPVPPTTLSKLYWSISVPKMTYELEVVPTNDYMIEELDKAHRQNARIVQNLPSMTHKPSTHATIGWLTMKSYIAIRNMVFLWSILCLPDTNIYIRLYQCSW